MPVRRDNLSITLRQVYQYRLSQSDPLLLNEVATQIALKRLDGPIPDLIHM